ncbi:MAG TPA: excalibur calcium-binding domain-containing protein [Mycobacterium sp.]
MIRIAASALIAVLGILASPAVATAQPYENCTEARANGDTNIRSSSDRYGPWLDRDKDGIGCES